MNMKKLKACTTCYPNPSTEEHQQAFIVVTFSGGKKLTYLMFTQQLGKLEFLWAGVFFSPKMEKHILGC
jgi:hypothetical protein